MLFDYRGSRPVSLTLKSGISLHLSPKQKNVEISEQDFFQSGRLSRMKKTSPHLFANVRYDEDMAEKAPVEISNKKIFKTSDFDKNDPKFKPNVDPSKQEFSMATAGMDVPAQPITNYEKSVKVRKKHIKMTKTEKAGPLPIDLVEKSKNER